MRVAMLSESTGLGGAEVMLIQLSSELKSRGHHVTLICPERSDRWLIGEAERRGVPVVMLQASWSFDPRGPLNIAKALRMHRIEILHAHMFASAVLGSAAAAFVHIPTVITLHTGAEQTGTLRRRLALQIALRLSAATTVVSDKMRTDLIEALGAVARRSITIPNGVPIQNGVRDSVRAELAVGPHEVVVLAVGSCCARKNQALLVDALAMLPREIPWRLMIAGREDDGSAAIRTSVNRHRVEDRVSLVGVREDVANLLAAADIFAMPSTWEGMPLALAEAMMAGLPAIASNVGGMPEMIEHGRSGFIAPELNAASFSNILHALLTQQELRSTVGQEAARTASRRFSVGNMADRYEALYQSFV
jgi:glycosyltransferase involved in cell wall biosynthesis